jgi:hypothetical protein
VAQALALRPEGIALNDSGWTAEAELRHTLHGAHGVALSTNLLTAYDGHGHGRVNEFYAAGERDDWGWSAGQKIVSWDVGYAFRPNDVVEQETRRTLLGATPLGRPLLQAEHFGTDASQALVWVNPQATQDPAARDAQESAVAARLYGRDGTADGYGFARVGRHSGVSLGAAVAWVASDALELHASTRALQRHDGWAFDARAGDAPVAANPWARSTLGGTHQSLIGLNWTGEQQQGLLVEAWYDGTALSKAQWRAWQARNSALVAAPAAPAIVAGNLAWQATPLDSGSLRRGNVFIRASWQPGHWQLTLDTLVQPADGGRIVTAGAQWQGDRWRLQASWRDYGGPSDAVLSQLPLRRSGLLLAAWTF